MHLLLPMFVGTYPMRNVMSSKVTIIKRLLKSLLLKSRLAFSVNSMKCAVCDDNGIPFK